MKHRGIGVLEFVLVAGILAFIVTLLAGSLQNLRSRHNLQEAAVQIIGMVHEARSRTLAGTDNLQYGVHFESGKATLFQGATYISNATTNDDFTLSSAVELNPISVTGVANDVVFARVTGFPSATGTVTVRLKKNGTDTVVVTVGDGGVSY